MLNSPTVVGERTSHTTSALELSTATVLGKIFFEMRTPFLPALKIAELKL